MSTSPKRMLRKSIKQLNIPAPVQQQQQQEPIETPATIIQQNNESIENPKKDPVNVIFCGQAKAGKSAINKEIMLDFYFFVFFFVVKN
jgi:hypothetical protein